MLCVTSRVQISGKPAHNQRYRRCSRLLPPGLCKSLLRVWWRPLAPLAPSTGLARGNATEYSAASISLAQLPPQRTTYKRIHEGARFPTTKMARCSVTASACCHAIQRVTTGNTPSKPQACAIVVRAALCGGAPRTPDICYYSDDHYASFREITP